MKRLVKTVTSIGFGLINNLSTRREATRDDLRVAARQVARLPIIAALAVVMLLGVLPATLPQSSAYAAASTYLADEIGQTEITVDAGDDFHVVLYVVDISGVAGYECKITVSGPATPTGGSSNGSWFAGGHSVFDGTGLPDYGTAMLLSPLDISGSGDVIVFTLHADQEGSVAINVDSDHFVFGNGNAEQLQVGQPSTLYVTVLEGDGLVGGGEQESPGETAQEPDEESSLEELEGGEDDPPATVTIYMTTSPIGGSDVWAALYVLYDEELFLYDMYQLPAQETISTEYSAILLALDWESYTVYPPYPGGGHFPRGYVFQHSWIVNGDSYADAEDFILIEGMGSTIEAEAVYTRNWRYLDFHAPDDKSFYGTMELGPGPSIEQITTGTQMTVIPYDTEYFQRWDAEGVELADPEDPVAVFQLNDDVTLTAIYSYGLTVRSHGRESVVISGNIEGTSGTTDYVSADRILPNQTVILTVDPDDREGFTHWNINGVDYPEDPAVEFDITEDTVAVACYPMTLHVYPSDPPAGAFDKIQDAVDASFTGDTIVLHTGEFTGVGNWDVVVSRKGITITSTDLEHPEDTTIDCGGAHRAFEFVDDLAKLPNRQSILTGVKILNGNIGQGGGAIRCENASPSIVGNLIDGCTASSGGAIYHTSSLEGTFIIFDNTISNCTAASGPGGAIFCANGPFHEIRITENNIYGCSAMKWGGAIMCGEKVHDTQLQVQSVLISENIFYDPGTKAGNRVDTNQAGQYESFGGAVCLGNCGEMQVFNNDFRYCRTRFDGHGGAISIVYVLPSSTIDIHGNVMIDNSGHSGGAIDIRGDQRPSLRASIRNCLIAGNSNKHNDYHPYRGAGIAVAGCAADIVNCTIVDNIILREKGEYEVLGGGIAFFGSGTPTAPSTVMNCIIRGNEVKTSSGDGDQIGIGGLNPSYVVVGYTAVPRTGDDIYLKETDPESRLSFIEGTIMDDDPGFASNGAWSINWSDLPASTYQQGEYHPKSAAGRFVPASQSWTQDSSTSFCIDGGGPESAYDLEPEDNGARINMGCYGNTAEASKSWLSFTFSASDQSTHSKAFTNDAALDASISATPASGWSIDGYVITESASVPTGGWQSQAPTSYSITGGEGLVMLYAWAKSTSGKIARRQQSIVYSEGVPVASGFAVADNENGTATATWSTDIPAFGLLKYGPVSMGGSTPNELPEAALLESHSRTFPIAVGTNYKFVLVNNESISAPVYWPSPWPILGDANQDCRVNILDLIFIRNKLNLDPGAGDNWKADVNEDDRINILDLIYVRNKLNTQCP